MKFVHSQFLEIFDFLNLFKNVEDDNSLIISRSFFSSAVIAVFLNSNITVIVKYLFEIMIPPYLLALLILIMGFYSYFFSRIVLQRRNELKYTKPLIRIYLFVSFALLFF